jgi:hypothetical protein
MASSNHNWPTPAETRAALTADSPDAYIQSLTKMGLQNAAAGYTKAWQHYHNIKYSHHLERQLEVALKNASNQDDQWQAHYLDLYLQTVV